MNIFIILLVVVGSIFLLIFIYSHEAKKIIKTKENLPNVIETFRDLRYIGGHPLVAVNEIKKGVLHICEDKIVYLNSIDSILNPLRPVFEISIESINQCTVESKESITLGRILLTGILAFALKKNEKYVRIEFKDDLGNISNILFEAILNSQTPRITAIINQAKLSFINKKSV